MADFVLGAQILYALNLYTVFNIDLKHPLRVNNKDPSSIFPKIPKLFLTLGFTPCKAKQPLWGLELQEKEAQKDYSIQEICLKRTYS